MSDFNPEQIFTFTTEHERKSKLRELTTARLRSVCRFLEEKDGEKLRKEWGTYVSALVDERDGARDDAAHALAVAVHALAKETHELSLLNTRMNGLLVKLTWATAGLAVAAIVLAALQVFHC